MSFLKKIFGSKKPTQRVRICVECGMPVEEHKEWCSIVKNRAAMEAEQTPQQAS